MPGMDWLERWTSPEALNEVCHFPFAVEADGYDWAFATDGKAAVMLAPPPPDLRRGTPRQVKSARAGVLGHALTQKQTATVAALKEWCGPVGYYRCPECRRRTLPPDVDGDNPSPGLLAGIRVNRTLVAQLLEPLAGNCVVSAGLGDTLLCLAGDGWRVYLMALLSSGEPAPDGEPAFEPE